jgi:hypothetical protein
VYGHSLIIDPIASILTEAEEKETIIYAYLDIEVSRHGAVTSTQTGVILMTHFSLRFV